MFYNVLRVYVRWRLEAQPLTIPQSKLKEEMLNKPHNRHLHIHDVSGRF